jgi:hypothetical protein
MGVGTDGRKEGSRDERRGSWTEEAHTEDFFVLRGKKRARRKDEVEGKDVRASVRWVTARPDSGRHVEGPIIVIHIIPFVTNLSFNYYLGYTNLDNLHIIILGFYESSQNEKICCPDGALSSCHLSSTINDIIVMSHSHPKKTEKGVKSKIQRTREDSLSFWLLPWNKKEKQGNKNRTTIFLEIFVICFSVPMLLFILEQMVVW